MKSKKLLSLFIILLTLFFFSPVKAAIEYITIGTGSERGAEPFDTEYRYSTTQSIYKASEIGGSGEIKSIAYQVAYSDSHQTTSVKIYMGHRSGNSFGSIYSYLTSSELTLVYSGSPKLATAIGWETITLDTPFYYNGDDNLVIVVGKTASTYEDDRCYYSTRVAEKQLTRWDDDDSRYGDALNTSCSYYQSTNRANIKIGISYMTQSDGFMYRLSGKNTAYVCGTTLSGSISFPSSIVIKGVEYDVVGIDKEAFKGYTNLTGVTIPNGVTSIGDNAFSGCM